MRTGQGLLVIPNANQAVLWGHIVNSYFDSASGGSLVQAYGTNAQIYGLSFVNDWFTNNNNIGLTFNQGSGGSLDGITASHLRIYANRQHGMYLEGGTNIHVGGESQICGNGLGSTGTYDGFLVNGATTHWSFEDSLSGSCSGEANTQRYGVNVASTGDYWRVIGNDLTTNYTGSISNVTTTHYVVANNLQ
jgi:hypothetical protein